MAEHVGTGVALQRVAGQRTQHNSPQGVVHVVTQVVGQAQVLIHHPVDGSHRVGFGDQRFAGQHFSQHEAHGKNIHQRGSRHGLGRFWRHVARAAATGDGPPAGTARCLHAGGNAKVHHPCAPRFVNQHIGGLQITVNHPLGMRAHQGFQYLDRQRHRFKGRQGTALIDQRRQRLAPHIFKHQVGLLVLHVGFKNRNDMGVGQAANVARLLQPA